MKKYSKALKEKLFGNFTISAVGWALEAISGVLHENFDGVTFRVLNGLEQILVHKFELKTQLFDINFHSDRSTFQLQHDAIKWIKSHGLFHELIENEKYSLKESLPHENLYEIR